MNISESQTYSNQESASREAVERTATLEEPHDIEWAVSVLVRNRHAQYQSWHTRPRKNGHPGQYVTTNLEERSLGGFEAIAIAEKYERENEHDLEWALVQLKGRDYPEYFDDYIGWGPRYLTAQELIWIAEGLCQESAEVAK